MIKICRNCDKLFDGGDHVRALIETEWVSLKSAVSYALAKPTACIDVTHSNCQYPKGEPDGD